MAISPLSQLVCNKKSPLTPLYERGEFVEITLKSSPFVKGDRGGFCCAFVLPKITAAHLLYELSYTTSRAGPFLNS